MKQCQQHCSPATYFFAWPTSQGGEHTLSGGSGCPSLNWIAARNMRVGSEREGRCRSISREKGSKRREIAKRPICGLPDIFNRNSPERYLPTRTHSYLPGSICLKCMMLYRAGPSPFLSNLNLSPLRPSIIFPFDELEIFANSIFHILIFFFFNFILQDWLDS